MRDVLDASAAIAWLKMEPGGEVVESLVDGCVISSVNWSEVLQKAISFGREQHEVEELFAARGVTIEAATRGDAVLAARYWDPGNALSLADRFCLALAYRSNARAVTAERSWPELRTGAEVLVIR